MKKTLFSALPLLVFFLYIGNSYSQSMTDYTWDTYYVKFKIPATYKVDKNSSDGFGAGDGNTYLSVYPKTGDVMTYNNMKSSLENWASDSKVSYTKVNMLENLNGYWGTYIDGTNTENNLPATLLLLVHPDYPTKQLFVWINYKSDAFDTALKMLKSFTPTY